MSKSAAGRPGRIERILRRLRHRKFLPRHSAATEGHYCLLVEALRPGRLASLDLPDRPTDRRGRTAAAADT